MLRYPLHYAPGVLRNPLRSSPLLSPTLRSGDASRSTSLRGPCTVRSGDAARYASLRGCCAIPFVARMLRDSLKALRGCCATRSSPLRSEDAARSPSLRFGYASLFAENAPPLLSSPLPYASLRGCFAIHFAARTLYASLRGCCAIHFVPRMLRYPLRRKRSKDATRFGVQVGMLRHFISTASHCEEGALCPTKQSHISTYHNKRNSLPNT
jgi:hypothetical protein